MTYQTNDVETDNKVAHLHYFMAGFNAWIVERDVGDSGNPEAPGAGEGIQHQAYGLVDMSGIGLEEAEWGYTSIAGLIAHGFELDLHWEPKTISQIKAKSC